MILMFIFAVLLGFGVGVAVMYAAYDKAHDDASEVRRKYIKVLYWIIRMPDSCITEEYVKYRLQLTTAILGYEENTEQEEPK